MNILNNIYEFDFVLDRQGRSAKYKSQGAVIWLTGLSGSGKSTIANHLEQSLFASGYHSVILDGDGLRKGLCQDLGFSQDDRQENIRRTAHIAKILLQNNLIVICSLISPLQAQRQLAREIIGNDDFVECYVQASLEVCQQRDPKGIYQKNLSQFSGKDSVYEAPSSPEIIIDTQMMSPSNASELIIKRLRESQKIC